MALSHADFRDKRSKWIRFSKHDSKNLRPDMITDFEWKDYSAVVFRHIHELENIDNGDYMLSICGIETLNEVSLARKTGCLIRISNHDQYLIKTLKKSEVKALQGMLPNYYRHIKKFASSLLVRMYGLHFVRPVGGAKVYFVVMSNIFQSDPCIHKSFDLNGSSQGRIGNKGEFKATKLKDMGLDLCFYLDPLV